MLNFIKDVLGENLSKSNKKEILNHQEAVASTLSFNKNFQLLNSENQFTGSPFEKSETKIDETTKKFTRGWFDFRALNVKYNNEKIFNEFLPFNQKEQNLFKLFNSSRCLALGFTSYKGCRLNFKNYFTQLDLIFDFKLEKNDELFFKNLLLFFDSSGTKFEPLKKIYPKISKGDFDQLFQNILDQKKFSKKCIEIIKKFFSDEKENHINSTQNLENTETNQQKTQPKKEEKPAIPKEKLSQDSKEKKERGNENTKFQNPLSQEKNKYSYYTREFDLFVNAENLSDRKELINLRKKFEIEYFESSRLINKLVRKLNKLFNSLNSNAWNFDQEEGYFDTSKFASFIANPAHREIYKNEKEIKEKNTIVSLLLDNSGSMRGKPIIISAITTEIITKVLEKCNVNVEILGFTTREWKGGNSKKKWMENGKPNFPGRLNDLLHIIYKDANSQWYKCKNNLGLILKEGLLKENIDGEALLWAYNRLIFKQEKKKILIIISDGAPVDDSTLSTNSPNILDDHLKEIVNQIEKKNKVNLLAIGIGHDVSKYYKNAFVIDDVDSLGEVIIENLSKMLITN